MTTTRHPHHPSQGTIRHREQNATDSGGFEVKGGGETSAERGGVSNLGSQFPRVDGVLNYEMSSRKSITEDLAVLRFTAPLLWQSNVSWEEYWLVPRRPLPLRCRAVLMLEMATYAPSGPARC